MPTKAGKLKLEDICHGRVGWIVETRGVQDGGENHGSMHTDTGEVRLVWVKRVFFTGRPHFRLKGNEWFDGWAVSFRGKAPGHDGEVRTHYVYGAASNWLVGVPHETEKEAKLRNMIEGTRPVGLFATRAAADRYLAQFPILERAYF